jgi:hypothetical protein
VPGRLLEDRSTALLPPELKVGSTLKSIKDASLLAAVNRRASARLFPNEWARFVHVRSRDNH